ncbi:MAG: DUF5723 family protein [Fidelibacterota bacterium]
MQKGSGVLNRVGPGLLAVAVLVLTVHLEAQAKRNPRMVGLAGAYTTIADGVYAVGVNPANLAYQHDKPFMWQMGTLDFGVVNNFFSLENWTGLSGANLERNNQEKKKEIFNQIRDGLRFTTDTHLALPALNYASGNMAFTSDLIVVGDATVPEGMFRLILEGNPVGKPLDMTLNYELLGLAEYGFSFAVPYELFSWGVTLKYLQGIFYLGIDPDSSFSDLVTDTTAFYGQGRYFIRQGIGGNGFGLDLGFATPELNGWRVGVALINALGAISWNRPSLTKDLLGVDEEKGLFSWGGEPVPEGSAMVYEFSIDSVNFLDMTERDMDDIFVSSKRVVPDTTSGGEPRPFTIRYPALFRVGISRQVDPDFLVISDLVAGFQDRLYVQRRWKWSIGVRFSRFPGFPLRLGYSWGGRNLKELGLGFGIHKGPLIFDFALAFRNGIWIHSMKGISLSMGFALTSFKSRKE